MFIYCSDGGPDQQYFRKLRTCHAVSHKVINELEIFVPCLCHADHNIYKSGLAVADSFLKEIGCVWRFIMNEKAPHQGRQLSEAIGKLLAR